MRPEWKPCIVIKLRFTKKKDGREVAWYRDSMGRRVGTRAGSNWTQARQMMTLALYGIQLILDRTAKGIGSDDAYMPALKQPKRKTRWSISQKKVVEYGTQDTGYPAFKRKLGLKPVRDLRGPGGQVATRSDTTGRKWYLRSGSLGARTRVTGLSGERGHMLDDIRVNYVDDKRVTIDISTRASRIKARANEERAPWWGWSPSDMRKLMSRAAEIFPMGIAERLYSLGLIAANQVGGSVGWFRQMRANSRKVA
jgi:hypothetical protein